MVLQRDKPITIWGWAKAKEQVSVQFRSQFKKAWANASGKWQLQLAPEQAGGPYTLTVSASSKIVLKDVVVGEVWLASGQSNMEMPVKDCADAKAEINNANYPLIRQVTVPRNMSDTPQDRLKSSAKWHTALPENVGDFSAVGYYFAREIHQRIGIPVGIVHASWGGTLVETWTSKEGFLSSEELQHLARLPRFNKDSLLAVKKNNFRNRIIGIQAQEADMAVVASFSKLIVADTLWPLMDLPAIWEQRQLTHFDGIVWFRKYVDISAEDAGKPAILSLGTVYDADQTWLNGKLVGKAGKRGPRTYIIPEAVLKAGRNSIAIRIENHWAEGGITGSADDLHLQVENGLTYRLSGDWRFQVESVSPHMLELSPNTYPSLLFNGMIQPLIPFSIRGVLWYQGETNAHWAHEYRKSFPALINDWRSKWKQGDFPFYYVQLTSYNAANGNDSNTGSSWAELREAQQMALVLPNTGMAVTLDIGDAADIHPLNKQDIGKRLAWEALHNTYQQPIISSGPRFQYMQLQGNKAIVTFSNAQNGLMVRGDKYGYLKGFEIAGSDKKFYFAKAIITGNRIILSSDSVPQPVAVRYGWADDASDANLFNVDGLPAGPFRTDSWKGITIEREYQFLR